MKKNIKGIKINFDGLSFLKRLDLWWAFTRAIFLNKRTTSLTVVSNIDIYK